MRIGIFYGSSGQATSRAAELIADALGRDRVDLRDIRRVAPSELSRYQLLILGAPTYGQGGLQEDWAQFIWRLGDVDLSSAKVALFGLGDQAGYPYTFLDAMGTLYRRVVELGAHVVGQWPTQGYCFYRSAAVIDDYFVGLALDDHNQPDLTPDRVREWVRLLTNAMSDAGPPAAQA